MSSPSHTVLGSTPPVAFTQMTLRDCRPEEMLQEPTGRGAAEQVPHGPADQDATLAVHGKRLQALFVGGMVCQGK
jgi:hypothetical protein